MLVCSCGGRRSTTCLEVALRTAAAAAVSVAAAEARHPPDCSLGLEPLPLPILSIFILYCLSGGRSSHLTDPISPSFPHSWRVQIAVSLDFCKILQGHVMSLRQTKTGVWMQVVNRFISGQIHFV